MRLEATFLFHVEVKQDPVLRADVLLLQRTVNRLFTSLLNVVLKHTQVVLHLFDLRLVTEYR